MKKIDLMFAAIAAVTASLLSTPALAAISVVRTAAPAPTYATTLNFDEPGGPTGSVPTNSYAGIGISVIQSGTGDGFVGNFNGAFPWLPNNNAMAGPFGIFINYSTDLTSFSIQAWDSGTSGPFGGGFGVAVLNDGVEVGFEFYSTTAWGGIGNTWYNITTTGGSVFDEVRLLGFGNNTETFVDNLSWNVIPTPGALALLGLAGFTSLGRRRR